MDDGAVSFAWDYLNSQDRYLRYAARIAIEWQPISQWQEKALNETRPTAAINALVALIRANAQSPTDNYPNNAQTKVEYRFQDTALAGRIIESLNRLNLMSLPKHRSLPRYGLCFIRLGRPSAEDAKRSRGARCALSGTADVRKQGLSASRLPQCSNVIAKP
jgi:hypothetical protein